MIVLCFVNVFSDTIVDFFVLVFFCFKIHTFSLDEVPNVDETIRQANIEVQAENRNLQALNTSLHEKYHTISLKVCNASVCSFFSSEFYFQMYNHQFFHSSWQSFKIKSMAKKQRLLSFATKLMISSMNIKRFL